MNKLILAVCLVAISCNSPKTESTTISQVPITETDKNSPNTTAQKGDPNSTKSDPNNGEGTETVGANNINPKNETKTNTTNVITNGKTNNQTKTTATLPTSNGTTNKETVKNNLNNNTIETKTNSKNDASKVTKNDFRNSGNTSAPSCIQKLIKEFQAEEKKNPPRKIYSYMYKGSTVYYVTAPCCDFFTDLYDKNCNLMGHPDGGITGRGDSKLTDFLKLRTNEKLVWKDERK